ncbi:MAG: hypothetical protein K8I00_06290 [Candidatus Omnitrophica bacterium]|nr:hypothetical protein [Candidatus Omnitrophota bacterium]
MGSRIDEVLTMTRSSKTYYYNTDGLGSVRQVLNSSGTTVESYDYDPYGQVTIYNSSLTDITSTGSGIDNPYMFTGRRFDEETGIYFYRARQYDPEIGRFLQRDPLGYYDSMNLFEYVGSNPVNWIDPFGLKCLGEKGDDGIRYYDEDGIPVYEPYSESDHDHTQSEEPQESKDNGKDDGDQKPDIPRPKDFWNPNVAPGPDWEWRGNGTPESGEGNWYNPKTKQRLHPDLKHRKPKGPHWGYSGPDGSKWDIYPDGTIKPPSRSDGR